MFFSSIIAASTRVTVVYDPFPTVDVQIVPSYRLSIFLFLIQFQSIPSKTWMDRLANLFDWMSPESKFDWADQM